MNRVFTHINIFQVLSKLNISKKYCNSKYIHSVLLTIYFNLIHYVFEYLIKIKYVRKNVKGFKFFS